jgi:hypothetical protein
MRNRFDVDTIKRLIEEHAHWDRIEQMSIEQFGVDWEVGDPDVPGFEALADAARENELQNTVARVCDLTGWSEDESSLWLCGGPISAGEAIDLDATQVEVLAGEGHWFWCGQQGYCPDCAPYGSGEGYHLTERTTTTTNQHTKE